MLVRREQGTIIENVELKRAMQNARMLCKTQKRMGSHCIWKGNVRSLWTRQLETKEYSRTHGLRITRTPRISPEKMAKKETNKLSKYFEPGFNTWREGKMAPGKYFSTTERKAAAKSAYPAPGAYFPDIFKYSSVVKKSFTKTPTFEWSGLRDRFKPGIDDSWKPPVGFYNAHKINCIDDILAKKVSRKGPYELFTGRRDNTTIMSRFKLVPETLDKFYTLPTDLDYLLHHPVKKRYGVMYREKVPSLKELSKMVETPGPDTYNITFHTSRQLVIKEQSRTDDLRIPRASGSLTMQKLVKTKKYMMPAYFKPTFSTKVQREGTIVNGKYFTTLTRKPVVKNDNPAPGTYFPDIFKHSSVVKKSFTKTPTFEWSRAQDRFKSVVDDSWKLPANLYNAHKINCIESILKKRVSLKGPYQLFTGPRDDTTIKNHFGPKTHSLDRLYAHESGLDYLLRDPRKKQCGVIYREYEPNLKELARKVKVETPGPTTYNITSHTIKAAPPGKVPFNINVGRRSRKETITPGPGRYFITYPERRRRNWGDVQSKHLKHLEIGDKMMATAILKKQKELARKMRQKKGPYIPAHIAVGSRYVAQKLAQMQLAETSRRQWEESEQSGTTVRRQLSGWDVVPLAVKNALYQHPAVEQVRMVGHPTQAIAGIPFVLVELKEPATEEELLQFVKQHLGAHVKLTAGLKIVRTYDG